MGCAENDALETLLFELGQQRMFDILLDTLRVEKNIFHARAGEEAKSFQTCCRYGCRNPIDHHSVSSTAMLDGWVCGGWVLNPGAQR